MGIQNWSEDIILIDLPQEPQTADELRTVTEIVCDRGDCDVVIDFSSVDICRRQVRCPGRFADCKLKL
jgi:hypothetical protein